MYEDDAPFHSDSGSGSQPAASRPSESSDGLTAKQESQQASMAGKTPATGESIDMSGDTQSEIPGATTPGSDAQRNFVASNAERRNNDLADMGQSGNSIAGGRVQDTDAAIAAATGDAPGTEYGADLKKTGYTAPNYNK